MITLPLKKNTLVLYLDFLLILITASLGIVGIKTDYPILFGIAAAAAVSAEILFAVYFRSLGYICENGLLTVNDGILFRRTRYIGLSSVLCRKTVSLCGKNLFCIIYTPGGRHLLFCNIGDGF